MSEIHNEMEAWGRHKAGERTGWLLGVKPAEPGERGVAEVLEVLGDGEAHTVETIDSYLQLVLCDISGCAIAACLGRLVLDGHPIQQIGPYDSFGEPQRFKLPGVTP